MIKSGVAFHEYHDHLISFCTNYDERVKYIKKHKSAHEQTLRLRLFKLIPEDRVPGKDSPALQAFYKTGQVYYKAWQAYNKAGKTYDTAYREQILKLHTELCPNCTFNEETIFTRKNEAGEWY